MASKQIRVGTTVTVEVHGQTITGTVYRDEEGTHRIDRDGKQVSVHRDADGYFPSWVLVLKIGK